MNLVPKRLLGGVAILALVASACSSNAATTTPVAPGTSVAPASQAPATTTGPTDAPKAVTVEWWHITTGEPGKSVFQGIADTYMAAHPNVTIKITILENEAFKTKLATTMQSGQGVPDLFQSWGGGIMAQQASAGMLKDISTDIASWKATVNPGALSIYSIKGTDGTTKVYGVPWDMGMIGVWYNKALFAKAGISAPPATWDDFLADVTKLKTANIVPLAIAGKDEWPAMHLWTYLALRIGGGDNLKTMVDSGNWNTDACTAAGDQVVKLNALNPYQPGYKAAVYDKGEAAAMGNAKAAMEVMGQWAPGVQATNSTSGKGIGADLGWFPFPTVAGGKGAATDGVGGGNGIAVGKNASPEAIDFLKFINSVYNAQKIETPTNATKDNSMGLSPIAGVDNKVLSDPLQLVLAGASKATFMQLYLDQATNAAMGQAINDATGALFAGVSTPAKVCQAITDAAKKK